jgi:hypothetical protein
MPLQRTHPENSLPGIRSAVALARWVVATRLGVLSVRGRKVVTSFVRFALDPPLPDSRQVGCRRRSTRARRVKARQVLAWSRRVRCPSGFERPPVRLSVPSVRPPRGSRRSARRQVGVERWPSTQKVQGCSLPRWRSSSWSEDHVLSHERVDVRGGRHPRVRLATFVALGWYIDPVRVRVTWVWIANVGSSISKRKRMTFRRRSIASITGVGCSRPWGLSLLVGSLGSGRGPCFAGRRANPRCGCSRKSVRGAVAPLDQVPRRGFPHPLRSAFAVSTTLTG